MNDALLPTVSLLLFFHGLRVYPSAEQRSENYRSEIFIPVCHSATVACSMALLNASLLCPKTKNGRLKEYIYLSVA